MERKCLGAYSSHVRMGPGGRSNGLGDDRLPTCFCLESLLKSNLFRDSGAAYFLGEGGPSISPHLFPGGLRRTRRARTRLWILWALEALEVGGRLLNRLPFVCT